MLVTGLWEEAGIMERSHADMEKHANFTQKGPHIGVNKTQYPEKHYNKTMFSGDLPLNNVPFLGQMSKKKFKKKVQY